MTDIQARLADINARALAAQQKRDREFWLIVGFTWLIAIAAVIVVWSIPMARDADRKWSLDHQEQIASRR